MNRLRGGKVENLPAVKRVDKNLVRSRSMSAHRRKFHLSWSFPESLNCSGCGLPITSQ